MINGSLTISWENGNKEMMWIGENEVFQRAQFMPYGLELYSASFVNITPWHRIKEVNQSNHEG